MNIFTKNILDAIYHLQQVMKGSRDFDCDTKFNILPKSLPMQKSGEETVNFEGPFLQSL